MMTPRQRFVETLTFGHPDRIPFEPGWPRESTLAAWRKQGLPEGVDWWSYLLEQLKIPPVPAESRDSRPMPALGVDFRMIPQFEEKVLDRLPGTLIVQDWKGNVCEIADNFDVTYLRTAQDFVTRRWLKCPVATREDWAAMKRRYEVEAPGRFPADLAERCRVLAERRGPLALEISGPFWQLREWCGFEGLCFIMADDPAFVDEMAEFWSDFVSAVLARILPLVAPDIIRISEDMAYKAHAMISPEMTRRFCQPSWTRWTRQARAAGVPLIDVDSDGFVGELLPLWIESGINVNDPVEVAAHNDLGQFRRQFGHAMAFRGGVDKRCMAKGGAVIRQELARIEPVIRDGGYIPGCDHGVPSDISWPAYVDYAELLARLTGWL